MHIYALKLYFQLINFHFITFHVLTDQQAFLHVQNSIEENNVIIYPHPLRPPSNFTLLRVIDGLTAEVGWKLLPLRSQQGIVRGYRIQSWSDVMDSVREIVVGPSSNKARINTLKPFTINYVRMYAFTDNGDGPTTSVITFEAPESIPGAVASFDAMPMSTRSIYLKWRRPLNANGILTGYNIYFAKKTTKQTYSSSDDLQKKIADPWITGIRISDLDVDTKYRFLIRATTVIGEGTPFVTESTTEFSPKKPDPPNFTWHLLPSIDGKAAIKVIWLPDEEGDHIGDEFLLAYRQEGQTQWKQVEPEGDWDEIILKNLTSSTKYALRMVVLDGDFASRSNVMIIKTTDLEKEFSNCRSSSKSANSSNKDNDALSMKVLVKCLSDQLLD